jgi:hypothetical protein
MANEYKITIRVNPLSRTEDISWRATGHFGALNLSTISGVVHNSPLTSQTTAEAQIAAILAKVAPLV